MMTDGRDVYLRRLGDPATWTGDWRRPGDYLRGEQQQQTHARMEAHKLLLVGMAVRRMRSNVIAAVFGVSRESVDRRLRPLGLKNAPGCVGRPRRLLTAIAK